VRRPPIARAGRGGSSVAIRKQPKPPAGRASADEFLRTIPAAAAILLPDGRIFALNARFAALLQRPAENLAGVRLRDLYVSDADRGRLDEVLTTIAAGAAEEFQLPTLKGSAVSVILTGGPAPAFEGTAGGQLILATDISRQKKSEERAREQYRALSRVSDSMLSQALEWKRENQSLSLSDAQMDSIYSLAIASEAKDADTGFHVRRIQFATEALARAAGIPADEAEIIGISAILHDVGKLIVPDEILKKPGALTDEERSTMQLHTTAGESILPDREFFHTAREIARSHHENWDGSGYPDGLRGEAIPLPARLVHVVDVFDALVSERVYKSTYSAEDAITVIRTDNGRLFDPELTQHFGRLYDAGALQDLWRQLEEAAKTGDWSAVRVPEA
jgi:PAS domain S-box-containing protein